MKTAKFLDQEPAARGRLFELSDHALGILMTVELGLELADLFGVPLLQFPVDGKDDPLGRGVLGKISPLEAPVRVHRPGGDRLFDLALGAEETGPDLQSPVQFFSGSRPEGSGALNRRLCLHAFKRERSFPT